MALNPFLSTGYRKSMLDGNNGVFDLFDGGELHIYDGSQPADADAAEGAGTILAKVIIPTAADEVLDGDMGTPASWAEGAGWTIAAGVATAVTSTADLDQVPANALIQNYEYEVTFTISNYSSGGVSPIVGSTVGTERSANGTFTEIIVAGAGSTFGIRGTTSASLDVDNVIIKIHAFQKLAILAVIAKNGDWKELSADATGTAAWFRLYKLASETGASTAFIRMDGTVGNGAGFDLDISGTSIVITDPVTVDTFTQTLLATDTV